MTIYRLYLNSLELTGIEELGVSTERTVYPDGRKTDRTIKGYIYFHTNNTLQQPDDLVDLTLVEFQEMTKMCIKTLLYGVKLTPIIPGNNLLWRFTALISTEDRIRIEDFKNVYRKNHLSLL